MNKSEQARTIQGRQDHNKTEGMKLPYWRRAHHDVGFWIMLLVMIVAMVFYVMSDNFALL